MSVAWLAALLVSVLILLFAAVILALKLDIRFACIAALEYNVDISVAWLAALLVSVVILLFAAVILALKLDIKFACIPALEYNVDMSVAWLAALLVSVVIALFAAVILAFMPVMILLVGKYEATLLLLYVLPAPTPVR